ncbi:MAG: hypothetical protein QOE70_1436 [Chthoniobacter sp.]|jgi:uncharacterized membrane protein|nr:hypothetical protein [Chthoniobacter sp.]
MKDRLIPGSQARAALLALLLASGLCSGFVAVRTIHTQQIAFMWFLWNLFLAWVPLFAALPLYALRARGLRQPVAESLLFVVWFLFFPNAPYIITDLVHLHERPPVPYWYDMIMIMAFALTGLFLGYLSLYLMQEIVRSRIGRWPSWAFVFVMLGLSAFGIYLGRFLRWNSWDVLLSPIGTLSGVVRMVLPGQHREMLAFSATFFAFSVVCYLIVYSFTHLHAWVERTNLPRNPEE